MLLVKVDWSTFQVKYMHNNDVFVVEDDMYFTCYTQHDFIYIVSEYRKGTVEENIMFIERYFAHNPLVTKVESVHLPPGMSHKSIEELDEDAEEKMEEAIKEQGGGEEIEISDDDLTEEDKNLVNEKVNSLDKLRKNIDMRETPE